MLHALRVHLDVFQHLGIDPRQQLQQVLEWSELLHLTHGREKILEVHPFLANLLLELLRFGRIEGFLRLFHQRHDVAHLQNASGHALRMKLLERIRLLADTDVLDRLLEHPVNRQRRTTARVAIELGEDHAGHVQRFIEALRDPDRLLTRHPVGDEQNFVGLDRRLELLQLVHHDRVNLQTTSGVDDDHAIARPHALIDSGLRDLDHVLRVAIGVHRHVQRTAKRLELIDRGRTIDVGRHQSRRLVLEHQLACELAGGGRLARPLQADHHDDRRRHGAHLEPLAPFAEHGGELVVDDLHQLLSRLDRLDLQHADRLRLDPLEEFAGEREIHVGFEKNAADFAQSFLDVGIGENATSAKLREHVPEFV